MGRVTILNADAARVVANMSEWVRDAWMTGLDVLVTVVAVTGAVLLRAAGPPTASAGVLRCRRCVRAG